MPRRFAIRLKTAPVAAWVQRSSQFLSILNASLGAHSRGGDGRSPDWTTGFDSIAEPVQVSASSLLTTDSKRLGAATGHVPGIGYVDVYDARLKPMILKPNAAQTQ